MYKFRRVRNRPSSSGVLGMPVGHSQSPVLHNRAFEKSNLDFAYMKFPANDLDDFFENARHCGIRRLFGDDPPQDGGHSVSERLGPEASRVGAVNTVSRGSDGWVGDNTDVDGVRAAFVPQDSIRPERESSFWDGAAAPRPQKQPWKEQEKYFVSRATRFEIQCLRLRSADQRHTGRNVSQCR